MVQIRNIKDIPVQLWKGQEYQGTIETYLQYLDVRLQIKNLKIHGYQLWFGGEFIPIDANGKLMDRPRGLFDKAEDLLTQLL